MDYAKVKFIKRVDDIKNYHMTLKEGKNPVVWYKNFTRHLLINKLRSRHVFISRRKNTDGTCLLKGDNQPFIVHVMNPADTT